MGFKEYVTNVRVAEAKRLLLSTDLCVAEVARAVSSTNLHQLYRVIYRSCAISPRGYRRCDTPAGGGRAGPRREPGPRPFARSG